MFPDSSIAPCGSRAWTNPAFAVPLDTGLISASQWMHGTELPAPGLAPCGANWCQLEQHYGYPPILGLRRGHDASCDSGIDTHTDHTTPICRAPGYLHCRADEFHSQHPTGFLHVFGSWTAPSPTVSLRLHYAHLGAARRSCLHFPTESLERQRDSGRTLH